MLPNRPWIGMVMGLVLAGSPATADVWDLDANDEDDSSGTDNELLHGILQVHDLAAEAGVVDEDWYRVETQPYSSYEFIAEGLTGEVFVTPLPVDRIASDGTTVLDSGQGVPGGLGATRSLRWQNAIVTAFAEWVRVQGTGTACTTTCTVSDQYTIRFYETTASVARFNNAGTQVTSLLLQNVGPQTVTGTILYFSVAGALIASQPFSLTARQLLNTATGVQTGPAGGSIRIVHDGRYGDLQGKAVALEPATGFSFDTPLVYRPR